MFNTKSEVDKHVENCLKKITNEKERNNRSYTFAKLYYNVGDYEQTRRYVSSYLSLRPKSPEGHYLLGLALEKLGKKDAALEAYRTSLQLDPKQNNLVLKVCELLANDDMELDIAGAKYFCELAENVDPYNPSIYNLKEKLVMSEQKNPEGVIKLLLKELESRPTDVNLRIRLLRNFVQNNKINEAFKHVYDIEEKNLPIFSSNFTWYETISDVLIRYKRQAQQNSLTWSFWSLFMSVLDKIMGFRLDEKSDTVKESTEYIAHLFFFDQSLYEASQNIADCPDRQLSCEFINHYRGQLYFHFATTILKQAKKDIIPFKEAVAITYPLFFSAYHLKPLDMHATWINHIPESLKRFVKRWHHEAAYRCSQSGHVLLAAAKDRKSVVIAKATQHSSGMWQEQLFKKVFVIRDQQLKMNSSYFVINQIDVNLKLPSKHDLLEFDEDSLFVLPDCLQHYVWVSSNSDLPELKYLPFQGLQYSVKNLSNCGAETLNLLDVRAFIYCATFCAKAHKKNLKQMLYYNMDAPDVLPEALSGQSCSVEQTKFLLAAYKMHKNEPSADSGEMRLTLIRGIEAVRCVGRHGLDVSLLVKLADIFTTKTEKSSKQSEIEFNDARAELYWKAALPLLEKMRNNQAVNYSTNRIFDYKAKMMPLSEICDNIDKGKLFLGALAMKRKELDKALHIFEELKDPYASFYQGQIYKQMADHQMSQNKESVTSEMRSQNIILLSKSRDCFYLTLDRLREPSVDKNHPLNAQLGTEIEKIERMLSRIDPDCSNRNECDGMSDENVSSADSNEHFTSANYTAQFSNIYSSPYVSRNETRNHQSTPLRLNLTRKEARPSPERLDAQLRQLIATRDAGMNQVLEQNRIMLESHRSMLDELRSFKDAVYNLSGQVDNLKTMKASLEELKDIKKSVDELKNSVDEFQNFRNVSDLVYELKREIADMKKDHTKPQATDDLYVLDDEYADYNISNNVPFNPTLYQNYPNRIPPNVPPAAAAAAACGLYPHGLYPPFCGTLPFGYPNLGFTQPALPYGADQQLPPEFRGLTNPMAQANALLGAAQHIPQPTAIQPPLNLTTPNLLTGQGLSQLPPQAGKSPASLSNVAAPLSTATSSTQSLKSAPVNVVITSSDPLPTLQSTVTQPVLSVTIPPQHIKGNVQKSQAHNYQIPLPTSNVSSTPSILSKPAPAISTEGILTNVAPPVYSAVSDKKTSLKTSTSETVSIPSIDSTKSSEIPPDNAGLNERTFFECPAKLLVFSYDVKEYKEKGSGLLKILENKEKKTVRIVMRQDLGKVLANHYITKDLRLASTKDNAYYWSALDYSGGKPSIEKLCLQFKKADEAKMFYEAFEIAKHKFDDSDENQKTANTSQSGNTFGGFVFTSTPSFKPKEPEQTPIQVKPLPIPENKTQSPFANFSFGVTNNSSATSKPSMSTPSLLSNMSSTPSKVQEQPLNISKQSDSSLTEEFVPNAEFQPVIPLPDIVEVKTGEEDAETLFDCRSKLLRFDSEKKEWKERGLGNMKILKEKTLIRLLMRREQVHKVCCNHQLLKEMNFQYMPNNLKAITWCAQDFADEILKPETFALRFKTEEQANDFLKCILSSQASLDEDGTLKSKDTPKKEAPVQPSTKGFGEKFKPAKGNWECKNCYISNESKAHKCIACESPRPIKKPDLTASSKESDVSSTSESVPKVASSWGDAFKPKAGTWECQCCLIRNEGNVFYCVSCESPKDDTVPKKEASSSLKGVNLETPFKFNFGIGTSTTAASPEPAKQETSAFKFGATATSGFGFGNGSFSFLSPVVAAPAKEDPKNFSFGSPSAYEFDFKPRSPRKSIGPGEEESDCSYVEEEADNIYFKPVIPLPDKVDVKTGEEEEEVLYCHRSKLFRFVGGEWKERGVGDLKILKNAKNNKLRVLMRRDQIFKICLNHALTSDVEYLPKDEKTWLFSAADFSEGEVSHEQFCIRFKTAEIAKGFKEAVDKAIRMLEEIVNDKEIQTSDQSITSDSRKKVEDKQEEDSEIEFVSESIVTAEESKEAERLGLPAKYFAYKQFPLCDCEQCTKDDEYFKGTILDENLQTKGSVSSSSSSGSPFFKTANTFSFTTTPQSGSSIREMLIKPSILAQKSAESVQCATPVSSSTTTAGNLFGSKFGSNNLFTPKSSASESALKSFSFISKTPDISSTSSSVSTNIFSTPSVFQNSSTSSIFGGSTPVAADLFDSNNSVFKNSFSSAQPPKNNLFQDNSANVFGSSTEKSASNFNSASNSSTNLFGSNTSSITSASAFGSNTSTTASIFGSEKNKSLFGTPKPEPTSSPFGSVNAGSLFGTSNTSLFGSGATYEFGKGGSIFSQPKETSNTSIFGNIKGSEPSKTENMKEDDEVVFKCSSDLTFSSLAKHNNSSLAPEFQTAQPGDIIQPFGFLGAGAPVFGSVKKQGANTTLDKSKQEDESTEEAGAEEDYDPHYEPIIPMPDAIVVSTGEEDETPVFNERAKLFRYDTDLKEWKERGVGQMKILHHQANGTYRFLLRREQVHKVVLNQLITTSLELQPMTTSDKAWMWAGYNYVEEQTNLEKLAIRFKNQELAQKFFQSVQQCITALKEMSPKQNLPASIQNYGFENVSSDSDHQDENYEQQNENDYDDEYDPYDDEDERCMMFSKMCTLQELSADDQWVEVGNGEIQVYFHSEVDGSRITFIDSDGAVLSKSVIGYNTIMNLEGNQCTWRTVELATDLPNWRELRGVFDSNESAQSFYDAYLDSVTYAQEWEISDELPGAEIEEIE